MVKKKEMTKNQDKSSNTLEKPLLLLSTKNLLIVNLFSPSHNIKNKTGKLAN